MARTRIYATSAARQAAYRRRKVRAAATVRKEEQATVEAAQELLKAIQDAGRAGYSDAVRLGALSPSSLLKELATRYRSQ